MAVFPNDYSREEFIHFLTQQEYYNLKEKFQTLPETITFNGKEYTMAIRVILFDIGFQNYIFNYMCDDELLFEKKIFTDLENGIYYLITGVGNLK